MRRTTNEQVLVGSVRCREDDTLNPVERGVSLSANEGKKAKGQRRIDEEGREERRIRTGNDPAHNGSSSVIGMSRSEVLMGMGLEGGMTTGGRKKNSQRSKRETRRRWSRFELTFVVELETGEKASKRAGVSRVGEEFWGEKRRGDSPAIPPSSFQQAKQTSLRNSFPKEPTWQLDTREGTGSREQQPIDGSEGESGGESARLGSTRRSRPEDRMNLEQVLRSIRSHPQRRSHHLVGLLLISRHSKRLRRVVRRREVEEIWKRRARKDQRCILVRRESRRMERGRITHHVQLS